MIHDPLERVRKAPKLWAQWHGGHSYRCPGPDEDIEVYADCAAEGHPASEFAEESFYMRRWNHSGDTPAVDDTCTMRLYLSDPTGERDPYPDAMYVWDTAADAPRLEST